MAISILMDKIICELYRKKIMLQGNFILKSGQESNIYINCRKISEHPKLMKMICEHMKTDMIKAEWVCGVPYGAIPLATLLSQKMGNYQETETNSEFSETNLKWLYKPIMNVIGWKWETGDIDKMVNLHMIINFILVWYYLFFIGKCKLI